MRVFWEENIWEELERLVRKADRVFVITDENTHRDCLPVIDKYVKKYTDKEFIIKPGEENKNVDTLRSIWSFLLREGATRHSLCVHLGGGMLTDIAGFAASTYKRGIPFVHIPTTLLAMVDAAVGGKTGINYASVKNIVGSFSMPEATLIHPVFLRTLDRREVYSGLAEIVKYALIDDRALWDEIGTLKAFPEEIPMHWIRRSVETKIKVVEGDPEDRGQRKILNFGHTAGHALESILHIRHGEAVLTGMLIALELSERYTGFPEDKVQYATDTLIRLFETYLPPADTFPTAEELRELMLHDKKNNSGEVRFVLLKEIGMPVWDVKVEKKDFVNALYRVRLKMTF